MHGSLVRFPVACVLRLSQQVSPPHCQVPLLLLHSLLQHSQQVHHRFLLQSRGILPLPLRCLQLTAGKNRSINIAASWHHAQILTKICYPDRVLPASAQYCATYAKRLFPRLAPRQWSRAWPLRVVHPALRLQVPRVQVQRVIVLTTIHGCMTESPAALFSVLQRSP